MRATPATSRRNRSAAARFVAGLLWILTEGASYQSTNGTQYKSNFTQSAQTPEPGALALFGLGLLGIGVRRHLQGRSVLACAALGLGMISSTAALAEERALSAQEITAQLVGKPFVGQAVSGAAKYRVTYFPDGKMDVVVNPDSQRPTHLSGTWRFEDDLLCRKLNDDKCQRIVADGDRYYWLDQDGTRTSYANKASIR